MTHRNSGDIGGDSGQPEAPRRSSRRPGRFTAIPAGERPFYSVLFLALLSALGQVSTNLYSPALAEVARSLQAPVHEIQLTLTFFFIAFAVAQLLFGRVAARFGRRSTLFVGLTIFAVASFGCAASGSAFELVLWRVAQGASCACTIVVSRSMAKDVFHGERLTRIVAQIMVVFALLSAVAPLVGAQAEAMLGWRSVFIGMALVGVALFGFTITRVGETRVVDVDVQEHEQVQSSIWLDRSPLKYALLTSLVGGIWYAAMAHAPIYFVEDAGWTVRQYSLIPASALFAFVAGSLAVTVLTHTLSTLALFRAAAAGAFLLTAVLCLGPMQATVGFGPAPLAALLIVYGLTMGLAVPSGISLTMSTTRADAGPTSAMLGFLQMAFAGLATLLIAIGSSWTDRPFVFALAVMLVVWTIVMVAFVAADSRST